MAEEDVVIGAAAGEPIPQALGNVEMRLEVVLGRARMTLEKALALRPGEVVELDRARTSPIDILVNNTLFGRGEIVVVDDTNFGIRITEIVGP